MDAPWMNISLYWNGTKPRWWTPNVGLLKRQLSGNRQSAQEAAKVGSSDGVSRAWRCGRKNTIETGSSSAGFCGFVSFPAMKDPKKHWPGELVERYVNSAGHWDWGSCLWLVLMFLKRENRWAGGAWSEIRRPSTWVDFLHFLDLTF